MTVVRLGIVMRDLMRVLMHVNMARSIMLMFVGMHSEGFPQGPAADGNKNDPDNTLAPDRDVLGFGKNNFSEPER